jgi:predicted outer membrane lipoprotein
MSSTVIFGLLVATILTLGIVPALYLEYASHRDRIRSRAEESGI